jgi:hypothetical protein
MPDFRIHGDNIVECERALELVSAAVDGRATMVESPPYTPQFRLTRDRETIGVFELVPGYGRWPVDLQEYLRRRGSPLREATDAVVTRCQDGKPYTEVPLFAVEFCGALPAGNNAWQRSGRALACAYAGVPYLYFADIGGLELDADREAKAPRFPNPLVPFAYLTMGDALSSTSAPVFAHSPSARPELTQQFAGAFGEAEALQLVRALLVGTDGSAPLSMLRDRALTLTKQLAGMRRRTDTLVGNEWDELAKARSKASWVAARKMAWSKRVTIPVSPTFRRLYDIAVEMGYALGSEDMPFCVFPETVRDPLAKRLATLYDGRASDAFLKWVARPGPLVCVWVCGFKPKGDDSRPDRGLVPLARMLVGESPDLLTVVYGPASAGTWRQFAVDAKVLATTNGLWEALLGLSDALLIDSPTAPKTLPVGHLVTRDAMERQDVPLRSAAVLTPTFGEHDVDTVLHLLFGSSLEQAVFEGLCNPPGGDWSGISYLDFRKRIEFRWTSLPRVSGSQTKRPDHLVQFGERDGNTEHLLAIESKETGGGVESGIGPRLTQYVESLMRIAPNISRAAFDGAWASNRDGLPKLQRQFISGAAFLFNGVAEMRSVLERAEVDVALGLEFDASKGQVLLHVLAAKGLDWFAPRLVELAKLLSGRIKVEIH